MLKIFGHGSKPLIECYNDTKNLCSELGFINKKKIYEKKIS